MKPSEYPHSHVDPKRKLFRNIQSAVKKIVPILVSSFWKNASNANKLRKFQIFFVEAFSHSIIPFSFKKLLLL